MSGPEEYELKGIDESTPVGLDEGSMSPPPPKSFNIKNLLKRLAVPLGIVIAIFIIYQILTWSSSSKKEEKVIMPPPKKEAVVAQAPAPIPVSAPVIAPIGPSQDQVARMINDQVSQSQTMLKNQLDDLSQQISSSREQVAALNDSINKDKQDIATINTNINNVINTLQAVVKTLQQQAEAKKVKKVGLKKMIAPKTYHVRAIVPGRAWIESDDGRTVTLREGDQLAGYGYIETISPKQGVVITSSGSVIQYGVNDI